MRSSLPPPTTNRTTAAAPPATAGANRIVLPFAVLIDDRERRAGYTFLGMYARSKHNYRPIVVPTRVVRLLTGDYSIGIIDDSGRLTKSFEDCVTIERKTLSDVFSSLAGKDGENRENFRAEHERMRQMKLLGGFTGVVIEASRYDARFAPPEYGAHPGQVLSASVDWADEYDTPWHWPGSRDEAEILTLELLSRAYERMTGKQTPGIGGRIRHESRS